MEKLKSKDKSKTKWSNLIWILVFVVILFTPVGTTLKVWVNRIFAFSPSVIEKKEQKKLNDYNWQLVNLEGEQSTLADHKGKVILINFWATWCPPCIAEMPSMQKLYTDYKDKVVFLFVTNDDRDKVTAFMKKNNYDLPIYQYNSSVPGDLNATSIPVTYLIDKEGNIVVDKTGSADWNSEDFRKELNQLLE
ncbi:TlpA family protein disulfide reductase [Flavobacterium sp. '19STA2R22 D10 B1']|uniref:TlpA family protein disulfide reductase n=1 Tax=Flavobacterium aerium TaxID=3037261 RepID=UPI00278C821F|nr:TlpA disulfide reductase family protein [Flavobacterium sp. '19STA2R22 D10 B1']